MKSRNYSIAFLVITLVIGLSDGVLVWVNYQVSRGNLRQTLSERGQQIRDTYQLTLDQQGKFMLQTAALIANDERVSKLFYEGRQAVEKEGGGAGGKQADALRKELYRLVSSGWNEISKHYKGRQLHFHLPPDISFLRVHRPDRFGDDLSVIRHTIMAANTRLVETYGFESGRVYAGIRGVVPVFFNDPKSGEKIHVGALEAGTSFTLMLEELKDTLSTEFAVMMTLEHATETMWPEALRAYTRSHPVVAGHLLEASTNTGQIKQLLQAPAVRSLLDRAGTELSYLDDIPFLVTSFPLRDYLGSIDPQRKAVGNILAWAPAVADVGTFKDGIRTSIIIAVIGFIVIEILIGIGLKSEVKMREKLKMAVTDGLTGIPNRRAFDQALDKEIARARRGQKWLSLVMCDIDFFKQYNDTYGHLDGDQCLQKVATALHKQLRLGTDFLARYGGEEFVVILAETDPEQGMAVAERLRHSIEALNIPHEKSCLNKRVTISCGLASNQFSQADSDIDAGTLIAQADRALYQAKNSGRNRLSHRILEPDMQLKIA